MGVEFTLNGRPVVAAGAPDSPLLWALRDEFVTLGVKFGCGVGLCGACTVLVEGAQTRSCQTALADVAGKSVTTIEGLSGAAFEAVVAGWIKAQAPQCGYCQPGFVTATTAVLAADPAIAREAALAQLTNLCRCGAYDAIREAVGHALDALAQPAASGAQPGAAPAAPRPSGDSR